MGYDDYDTNDDGDNYDGVGDSEDEWASSSNENYSTESKEMNHEETDCCK